MKITRKRTHSIDLEFKSVNETIMVKNSISNGPELTLSDNSVMVFTNSAAYYNLLTAGCITTTDVNLDAIKIMSSNVTKDDVSGVKYEDKRIIRVTVYQIYDSDLYKFDRA